MSITKLTISARHGDSPLEGVGFDQQPATYFWHPVSTHKSVRTVKRRELSVVFHTANIFESANNLRFFFTGKFLCTN